MTSVSTNVPKFRELFTWTPLRTQQTGDTSSESACSFSPLPQCPEPDIRKQPRRESTPRSRFPVSPFDECSWALALVFVSSSHGSSAETEVFAARIPLHSNKAQRGKACLVSVASSLPGVWPSVLPLSYPQALEQASLCTVHYLKDDEGNTGKWLETHRLTACSPGFTQPVPVNICGLGTHCSPEIGRQTKPGHYSSSKTDTKTSENTKERAVILVLC